MDERKSTSMMNRAAFTISIDVELAWGICDKSLMPGHFAAQQERQAIEEIIKLFNKYKISATWAVVGHLLSDGCGRKNGIVHPEFKRPIIHNERKDWFFLHPEENADPIWFGRDIVEKIKNAAHPQEIASHSFCHIPYDESKTDPRSIITDIIEAKRTHRLNDLPFKAFIFPRNIVGFKELLAQEGIVVYRGKTKRWYDWIAISSFKRFINSMYFILSIDPPTVNAAIDDTGMINVPDSMLLISRNGLRKLIPGRNLVMMGMTGLNRAAATGQIFHLWFHPQNFVVGMKEQLRILEDILRYAVDLKNRGRLQILTLQEIQKSFSGSETTPEDVLKIRQKAIALHNEEAGLFDKNYRSFNTNPHSSAFAYSRDKIKTLLRKNLSTLLYGSKVLDIGCGTGEQLKMCSELGLKAVGIEPAEQMRLIAQRNNPEVTISDGSVTNLPFPDKTFDFVFAIEVLRYLHSSDVKKSYREMLRVTKPGGRIFFSMVNRYALDGFFFYHFLKKTIRRIVNRKGTEHCEFVTPGQIRKDLNLPDVEIVFFYGLLFAPIRLLYKINHTLAAAVVKNLDKFFDVLVKKNSMLQFAGHLVAIVERSQDKSKK